MSARTFSRTALSIHALLAVFATLMGAQAQAQGTCFGKFTNPITGICWSCVLPVTIGTAALATLDQEDIPNPTDAACLCMRPAGVSVGIEVGFWEPARLIEVTRTPWCFPALGGVQIDPGIRSPHGGQMSRNSTDGMARESFYQVHYYVNPILYWLEVLYDFPCLEQGSIDLAYATEVDPTWNDNTLAAILSPEALVFGNVVAQAACAADCVASTAGFPLEPLFWCAGCNGPIFPLNGWVNTHVGGVQASSLLMQRMMFKMHRQLLAHRYWGRDAMCGPKLAPVMTKSAYKTQLVYPIPATEKLDGRCCAPMGRTTALSGAGKEFPIQGGDFAYQIFRKRNCCNPIYSIGN